MGSHVSSDLLAPAPPSLPDAQALPPGAVVLSVSGTDRTKLRAGFFLWTFGVLGVGIAIGYYAARRDP